MKTYKITHVIKPLIAILAIGLFTCSCEDDDKNIFNDFSLDGGFVRFVDNNPLAAVGVSEISELTYSFAVEDANKNAASYELSLYADLSGTRSDTVLIENVTSFPKSFSFTAESLASLLGITVDDISFGDTFYFSGTVTTDSGAVYSGATRLNSTEIFNGDNPGEYVDEDGDPVTIGPTDRVTFAPSSDPEEEDQIFLISGQGVTDDLLGEEGYRQAFEFDFIILCPPPAAIEDLLGDWQITDDPFITFVDDGIFKMIAGPEANQVTALDIFDHPNPDDGGVYDVVFELDPSTGGLAVAKQQAWHCDNFGCGFGVGSIEGEGFVFNCVSDGLMKLTFEHTVDAGSFGSFSMDMVKISED